MQKATGLMVGNGEILRVMAINNEGKMIEEDKKNIPKKYCMGTGGHRSRSGRWGDTMWVREATGVAVGDGETPGDGNQQRREDDRKGLKKCTKKVLHACGRP